MLELDQTVNRHVERAGNLDEHVDSHVGRPRLYFPEIGAARARHKREPTLRDAAARALGAYPGADCPLFCFGVHARKDMSAIVRLCSL